MQFFTSWMNVMIYAQSRYHLLLLISRTSTVWAMREEGVKQAMEADVDYILHMDIDEIYPPDTPERLMKHIDSGLEVVGGLYTSRVSDVYSAFDFMDEACNVRPAKIKPNTGLQKVDSMGFGGTMTDISIYSRLPEPWFEGVEGHGEDVAFCKRCKDAGVQVWVDTDLQYGHLSLQARYP